MRIFKNKKQIDDIEVVTINTNVEPDVIDIDKTNTKEQDVKLENKEEKKTKRVVKKKEKSLCKIVVAKPSYFVINKNGEIITINKKNNYRRGQDILY